MIHPDTELRPISPLIGLGVVATRAIPRGTVTWVYDDLDIEISQARFDALPSAQKRVVDHYSFLDARGLYVLCWDGGRYINHACAPTTICFGTICDVAVRDIQPGEELTCDYALLNVDTEMSCHCGASSCRGVVRPTDLDAVAPRLDAVIREVAPVIAGAAQPLLEVMRPAERQRLDAVLRGGKPPSCLENQARRR